MPCRWFDCPSVENVIPIDPDKTQARTKHILTFYNKDKPLDMLMHCKNHAHLMGTLCGVQFYNFVPSENDLMYPHPCKTDYLNSSAIIKSIRTHCTHIQKHRSGNY